MHASMLVECMWHEHAMHAAHAQRPHSTPDMLPAASCNLAALPDAQSQQQPQHPLFRCCCCAAGAQPPPTPNAAAAAPPPSAPVSFKRLQGENEGIGLQTTRPSETKPRPQTLSLKRTLVLHRVTPGVGIAHLRLRPIWAKGKGLLVGVTCDVIKP